ncbi:MAG: aminoacyl--tRNA ligase-related protein [Patescibacteria group bacterium]
MKQSQLFTKTSKEAPADADSINAKYLTQGAFVDQVMAGVYTYLPLGLRVLKKIQQIVREEINEIGGQEILMPSLTPKEPWETTGRWEGFDVLFKMPAAGDKEYALAPTHEEVVTPLAKKFIKSYKDLPFAVYQIQDKFRNELRAKAGILRGREFNMKDLYSFHASEDDMTTYYDQALEAYKKIFARCGINAIPTEASGGTFSKVSHEFQMPTESGEDTIFVNESGDYAWNREVAENMQDGDQAPDGSSKVKEVKAIEVGNIFKLKTKFTQAFDVTYTDENGKQQPVFMGCYGIGPSRVMGSIVEAHHDNKGIIWPKSVAPFAVHLVTINSKDEDLQCRILNTAADLYQYFEKNGVEVLWDDREASPGEKFADADLIGIPLRLVVSEKTLREESVEWKERASDEMKFVKSTDIKPMVVAWARE